MPNGNRAWCFTLNNPTEDETSTLPVSLPIQWDLCSHLCYQLEQGEQGTPHYQGYARFRCQRSLRTVRALLPRAHWEPARGTSTQNLAYCTKPDGRLGEPVILGVFGTGSDQPSSLKRTDFVATVQSNPFISEAELIDLGGLEVLATTPNLLGTVRGFLLADVRRDGVTSELYYGDTGTGKSRFADHRYPDAFRKTNGPWWDGYSGQTTVIFDDFDSDFMSIGEFLRVIDRYPLSVPVKGGFVRLVATHFVITSNHLPSQWYPDIRPVRLKAVHRRIARVFEFTQNNAGDIAVLQYDGPKYLNHTEVTGLPITLPWLTSDLPSDLPPASPDLFDLTPDSPNVMQI